MAEDVANARFEISWMVRGDGISRSKADPAYPDGMDADLSKDAAMTCTVTLPYPAQCVGTHLLVCKLCGVQVAVTAAGRADDPRSVRIACKGLVHA